MENIKQIIYTESLSSENKAIAVDGILHPIFYDNPTALSEEELLFVYIEELEMEINNGGFDQFFFNSSGNYTKEIVDSLNIIGANKTASIVIEATDQFPDKDVPKDMNTRQNVLFKIRDRAKDRWAELDRRFYEYEDNISELLIQYVSQNIERFAH